jgi:hypothetical protein
MSENYGLDYTKVSHTSLLEDWNNRVLSDPRYENLSHASIYSYLQEFIAGIMDMTNYYIQRTAEENYLDTAKLDSSIIKLCHNLGYQPKRPVPARANISINLHGPLPSNLREGDTIWLNNKNLSFQFNGLNYLLDACYSYRLTGRDIQDGRSPSWTKKIMYAVNGYEIQKDSYIELRGNVSAVDRTKLKEIGIFQGKLTTVEIDPVTYSNQVGYAFQEYDIDDLKFSNYFGPRDPFAYKDKVYNPIYGLCKIGIGQDEKSAFLDSHLFRIRDDAVELDPDIAKKDEKDPQLRIVAITSNPDKTAKISFGNGIETVPGLTSTTDKIYVQYLQSDGSDSNFPDSAQSQIRPEGKIYASGDGRILNVSNNITFLLESDLAGGIDFESAKSMKINAKLFYASNMKLISLPDWKAYLSTLVEPIVVRNAVAFGENQLDDKANEHNPGTTNLIAYSILSDIYRYANGRYKPINVFDENEDLSRLFLYHDKQTYLDHLIDFVKLICTPHQFCEEQEADNSTFGGYCKKIREDTEDRTMMNSEVVSIPPIFHYFDVVGNVIVDRHADMATFKEELENSIYKWLSENTTFGTKIYKTDISKKILERPEARGANIDIKVSSWIMGEPEKHEWSGSVLSSNHDVLKLPRFDFAGNDCSEVFFDLTQKNIKINVPKIGNTDSFSKTFLVSDEGVSVDDNYIYVKLDRDILQAPGSGGESSGGIGTSFEQSVYYEIEFEVDSFQSEGNLEAVDLSLRMLIGIWLTAGRKSEGTTDRPIHLPYKIEYKDTYKEDNLVLLDVEKAIRDEEFARIGANNTSIVFGLNENSLYYYLKESINTVGLGHIDLETVEENFQYFYPILKPIFDDNVLDDNNNIVNYGSDRDIPVLRLQLRYTYA